MLTLYQMKIITALIDNNYSVSNTAKKLFRVQSGISHQIDKIEKELGGEIFERNGKRFVRPTPMCLALLAEIRAIQKSGQNIQNIADEHTKKNIGDLRIATTYTQARYFLPAVIKPFHKKYPDVKIIFSQDNPLQFPNMLRRRELDLAVYAEDSSIDNDLYKLKCYRWNRMLVALRSHPLHKLHQLQLADIAQYPIITYTSGFSDRDIIQKAFNDAHIEADIVFSASDTNIIKTYAKLDLGIGIVSQMAKNPRTDGKLAFRSLSHLFPDSITHIVYSKDIILRSYIKDFINLLQDYSKDFQQTLSRIS